MHRLASNWTDVVFGFIPDPVNVPINMVSLSVLRSSLIDLFLEQSNLTLTTSIFGPPSTLEILRFPGGITIIPMQYASIWQIPQILFNFTLNNSISEVLDNFRDLKDQLESGLYLRRFETVYVKITNEDGSTINPPVTVQVSVVSDLGTLQLQRLKQLAQIITASPVKNLGLNNSVFGKVKSVVLSSYLKDTLHATPPTPSPAISPSLPPAIAPFAPVNSPAPSVMLALSPECCPQHGSATPPRNAPSGSNQTPRLHPEPPSFVSCTWSILWFWSGEWSVIITCTIHTGSNPIITSSRSFLQEDLATGFLRPLHFLIFFVGLTNNTLLIMQLDNF
ncbi:hypothetical protein OIU76_018663 [Salix suchowensis]|nr:hypothetical protein OIU76_018663 [Salix suchowensis]